MKEAIKVRCENLQKLQKMEDEMHQKLMTERRQFLEAQKTKTRREKDARRGRKNDRV